MAMAQALVSWSGGFVWKHISTNYLIFDNQGGIYAEKNCGHLMQKFNEAECTGVEDARYEGLLIDLLDKDGGLAQSVYWHPM